MSATLCALFGIGINGKLKHIYIKTGTGYFVLRVVLIIVTGAEKRNEYVHGYGSANTAENKQSDGKSGNKHKHKDAPPRAAFCGRKRKMFSHE